ncbi:hypothetical protein L210DRAFT_2420266 [Boletus edulis BED1]|uniref:Uncharacterized protein n=1 Tax=Boletus edulis BED1 TaxID=1328754 RepID=A0AAD4C7W9_BOLED|nr:hypothetical protein L210DRAFT_2420266 [Boletus edulis BED1]
MTSHLLYQTGFGKTKPRVLASAHLSSLPPPSPSSSPPPPRRPRRRRWSSQRSSKRSSGVPRNVTRHPPPHTMYASSRTRTVTEGHSKNPSRFASVQHVYSISHLIASVQLDLRRSDDIDEPFFTPTSSPFHSSSNSPAITPPISAASSAHSLPDAVPSSASLPDHATLSMSHKGKLTYTDEDWARDVRWLVAPRTDDQKPKSSKAAKRRSAPPNTQIPVSHSASSLSSHLPSSISHPHSGPPRPSKSKGVGKAKISTARSVIGMTALLEVEEDLDFDVSFPSVHDTPVPQKRVVSPDRPLDVYHKPRVSSPLRSSKLSRQRSFSSPPFLLSGDQTPQLSYTTPNPAPPSLQVLAVHPAQHHVH